VGDVVLELDGGRELALCRLIASVQLDADGYGPRWFNADVLPARDCTEEHPSPKGAGVWDSFDVARGLTFGRQGRSMAPDGHELAGAVRDELGAFAEDPCLGDWGGGCGCTPCSSRRLLEIADRGSHRWGFTDPSLVALELQRVEP
jgi:hypothetical protein